MTVEGPDMITVGIRVNAPVQHVWRCWTTAADIRKWNSPSDEWHSPFVELNLTDGGEFVFRMETKDGSIGFDHSGIYDKVVKHKLIEYTGNDGRKSIIRFAKEDDGSTSLVEAFEPDKQTPVEVQREFVMGVLDNFKKHAEQAIR